MASFKEHFHSTNPIHFTFAAHAQFVTGGSSGGPAGTVWAGPLFELLKLLLAINHYKTTN